MARLIFIFAICLFSVGCSGQAWFVKTINEPYKGGTITYDYDRGIAIDDIKIYCGKNGYKVISTDLFSNVFGSIQVNNNIIVKNSEELEYINFRCK